MNEGTPAPDLRVQAERLSGVGWRYTLPTDQGRQLVVVTEDGGAVHLVLVDPRVDEPLTTVRLPAAHAAALAALVTGARFTLEGPGQAPQEVSRPGEVVVETVRVAPDSASIGLRPYDLVARIGGEAALLGVISDITPELVETDERRGVQVGDKLILAARRGRLEELHGTI